MKELIPKDDYGIFVDNKDTMRVDSLFVAKMFGKRHDHVLRDIAKIIDPKSGLSKEFIRLNFQKENARNAAAKTSPFKPSMKSNSKIHITALFGGCALAVGGCLQNGFS